MKRFLCGVDGVILAGGKLDPWDGGVRERVFSMMPPLEDSKGSADKLVCGTESPNNSLRRTRE